MKITFAFVLALVATAYGDMTLKEVPLFTLPTLIFFSRSILINLDTLS